MKKLNCIFFFLFGITVAQKDTEPLTNLQSKLKSQINHNQGSFNMPRSLSYQGLLTKTNGGLVKDGKYNIIFRIFDVSEGGNSLWDENQEIDINDGIISVTLGKNSPLVSIPSEAFLEIEISGSVLSPRQELTSVFYSILSDTARYAQGGDYSELDGKPDLSSFIGLDTLAFYPLKENLDSVSFTGNYNDLRNLPDLSNLTLDTLSKYVLISDLDSIAFSGDYNDLNNLPDLDNLNLDTLAFFQPRDEDLDDLSDGTLSKEKIEYGEYLIDSEGLDGQVWTSDGESRGEWSHVLLGDVTGIDPGPGILGGGDSGLVQIAVDVGTGPGQIVQLDTVGNLPEIDGSALTNVIAGSVSADNISPGDNTVRINTSSGTINIDPAEGSPIILDGLITVTNGFLDGAKIIKSDTIRLENNEMITNDIDGTIVLNAEISQISGDLSLNGDKVTFGNAASIYNSDNDTLSISIGGQNKVSFTSSSIVPQLDNSIDIGQRNMQFKNLHIDSVAFIDAIGFGSTPIVLPERDGTNGQILKTDGAGSLSWGDIGVADSILADDIIQGDSTVSISTSSGSINISPAPGSTIVLDGTVNIDEGIVTGISRINADTIRFRNSESITNNIDGILSLNALTTQLSGNLSVSGNIIEFGNGESISNSGDDSLKIYIENTEQINFIDGAVLPDNNNDIDLGSSSKQFRNIFVDSVLHVDAIGLENIVLNLPSSDGDNGQVLKTDGSGTLSWDSPNAGITGSATTIDTETLTASRALVTNASGKVDTSAVTLTELSYLDGVTSSVQTQLNNKQAADDDLTDLADGTLTASKVENNEYFITSAGSSGQIWTSDGDGAGTWTSNSAASNIDGLSDAKSGGSNFTNSIIIGHQTTGTLNAAQNNVALGLTALDAITSGDNNTAIGYNALSNVTTEGNLTAVGHSAAQNNTSGSGIVALGFSSLPANNTGDWNTGVGGYSLRLNTSGFRNTGLGYKALEQNSIAGYNTAVGYNALLNSDRTSDTDGYNTGLGDGAGNNITTGNKNTFIGASTTASSVSGTNQTVFGYGATGQADHSVTLGNSDVTAVYMAQDQGATVYAGGIDITGSTGLILENDETITNSTDGTIVIDAKADFNDNALTGYGADIQTESGTSKTLAASDNGTIIVCSSGSAVTITVPASLPTGFNCMIIQSGSGQVSLSASSTTLNNRNGIKTAGQHAIMTLVHLGSNTFVISGDTTS